MGDKKRIAWWGNGSTPIAGALLGLSCLGVLGGFGWKGPVMPGSGIEFWHVAWGQLFVTASWVLAGDWLRSGLVLRRAYYAVSALLVVSALLINLANLAAFIKS